MGRILQVTGISNRNKHAAITDGSIDLVVELGSYIVQGEQLHLEDKMIFKGWGNYVENELLWYITLGESTGNGGNKDFAIGRSLQHEKASEVFDVMKRNNWKPTLVNRKALINAYESSGYSTKELDVSCYMEQYGMQPNIFSVLTLRVAYCHCCQSEAGAEFVFILVKVLLVAKFMREKISLIDTKFFEMVSTFSILQDWRIVNELISMIMYLFAGYIIQKEIHVGVVLHSSQLLQWMVTPS